VNGDGWVHFECMVHACHECIVIIGHDRDTDDEFASMVSMMLYQLLCKIDIIKFVSRVKFHSFFACYF
jgi:hypothetical protein